ncbi:MAG: excisionase family DNA-binding protein [Erysipelotrichaceae bacterium]|nr:excisionase family DNA-binding protein [Erysipelotrichaceae bacterium]
MTALRNDDSVPLWQKSNLTLDEAAVYSGIGKNRIRQLSDDENCEFVLWVGTKRLIKRKQFDEFISKQYSI